MRPTTSRSTENWWPSEWGADDKVGAVNRTTPEMVMKAVGLVKQGKTATLGKLYARDIPFFGARGWLLEIPGTPTGGPFGSNGLVFHDELVTAEIGQVGTQFDGPGHIGVRTSKGDMFYNGREREATYQRGAGQHGPGHGRPRRRARRREGLRLPRRAARRAPSSAA